MEQIFYRYEYVSYSEFEHELKLKEYEIIKETNKGYRIRKRGGWLYASKHFILKEDCRKKFARETKQRALTDYIKRTTKRIDILTLQLSTAKFGFEEALRLKIID